MKSIIPICVLLISCGPGSSPEGRMNQKIDIVEKRLDSLIIQQAAILDSLGKISNELKNQSGRRP